MLQARAKAGNSPTSSQSATTYGSYPTNGPSASASAHTNGRHGSDRSDRDEVGSSNGCGLECEGPEGASACLVLMHA